MSYVRTNKNSCWTLHSGFGYIFNKTPFALELDRSSPTRLWTNARVKDCMNELIFLVFDLTEKKNVLYLFGWWCFIVFFRVMSSHFASLFSLYFFDVPNDRERIQVCVCLVYMRVRAICELFARLILSLFSRSFCLPSLPIGWSVTVPSLSLSLALNRKK